MKKINVKCSNVTPSKNIKKLIMSVPKVEKSKNYSQKKYFTAVSKINNKELYQKALENIFDLSEMNNDVSNENQRNNGNIYKKYRIALSNKKVKNEENELDPTISIFHESFGAKCDRNNAKVQMAGSNSFLTNNNNSFNMLYKEEERQNENNNSPYNNNIDISNEFYGPKLSIRSEKKYTNEKFFDTIFEKLFADLDLTEYIQNFFENKIFFEDLILLSKDDFLELKIPLGPRNRLLKFIEDYNKENLKNNVEKENFEEKFESIRECSKFNKNLIIEPIQILYKFLV